MAKASKVPRIMYIESKAESLNGPARIGRVTFSKTGLSIYYRGKKFLRIQGFKANYQDAETHDEYWISGPRRDGKDVSTSATSRLRSMRMSEKGIGRRFERSLSSRTGLRPERIPNRQPTIDHLPVLHILRVQDRASRLQGRGDDEGIIDFVAVSFRDC